ncbi:DUF4931 domain-containing protein [Sporolituus thermophilus]|uniref:Galactose-1-phosphate uridylyltransferase n=1 Tax=Sporolituus thermophilus DSM 23256 TaxID=1123285 RepID=A0A1G7LSD4_9FIRM|nr:DUF4931 domain-containing protein [Sporolituus thermophilus]SDF52422.1 Galactose-1-phosphate uridylyltransferase [Sporolituus thermophilus DSM 23256]
MTTHLAFDTWLSRLKPENIINRETKCPFCDRSSLVGVLAEQGPILLIKNKYPVLQDAFQTVLIETDHCDAELSTYPQDHLYAVIRFGVENWLNMEKSGEFKSVLFFKNHGPLSGGTIRHPHMQIVGLKNIDYRRNISADQFEGLIVHRDGGVEFNISTKPRVGFFEFNVILHDFDRLDAMADAIQTAAHYILNGFHKNCTSYNLFFYHFAGRIWVKIVPRFVMSPIFVGYAIPQVSTHLEEVVQDIKNRYYR